MTHHFDIYSQCPICGKKPDDRPFFDQPYGSGAVFEFIQNYYHQRVDPEILQSANLVIQWCHSCDFYWHETVLNSENLVKLYNHWIDPKQSYQKQAQKTWQARIQTIHAIARQLNLLNSSQHPYKVLDFGGGWGEWALAAKALGCEAYLMETSKERVHFAQKQGLNVVQDLTEIPPKSLDLIILNQVLEHIPKPKELLFELVKYLRIGGGCNITVPEAKPTSPVLVKGAFQPLEHVNGFTHKSLKKLVEVCHLTPYKEYVLFAQLTPESLFKTLLRNSLVTLLPQSLLPLRTNIFAIKK